MYRDIVHLTDPVQASNALLNQVRLRGQVKHHQMAGELKISTFTSDLRADHDLSSLVSFREITGGPVSGHQVHTFVEGS